MALAGQAQSVVDTTHQKVKEPIDWKPSLVRLGYDMGGLGLSAVGSGHVRLEGMAEIDISNWFAVVEGGYQSTQRGLNYTYQSSGTFWRIGADKNLTPKLPGGHVVSFGFRYARSSFQETFEYGGFNTSNPSLTAGWLEMTSGIRMKLWRQLYMGYQIRLRGFKRTSDDLGPLQTYDIPGFGRNKKSGLTVRNGGVGFNYYVYWTIPYRQKQLESAD